MQKKNQAAVTLQNISKTFHEKKVLSNLSLQLDNGEIYALMGASGSGKTTLLRILMGIEQPDNMMTDTDGEDSCVTVDVKRISAVFQENRLCEFADPVHNIRMAAGGVPLLYEAEEILRELGLGEVLKQRVCEFSGGMKRRCAIARSLAVCSELLLMDEPFTGLDAETKKLVINAILNYRAGRTLLVVTHQEDDVKLLGAKRLLLQQ